MRRPYARRRRDDARAVWRKRDERIVSLLRACALGPRERSTLSPHRRPRGLLFWSFFGYIFAFSSPLSIAAAATATVVVAMVVVVAMEMEMEVVVAAAALSDRLRPSRPSTLRDAMKERERETDGEKEEDASASSLQILFRTRIRIRESKLREIESGMRVRGAGASRARVAMHPAFPEILATATDP